MRIPRSLRNLAALIVALGAAPLQAQQASLVYRLGKDTVAIEQYTRTAKSLTGEMVQRSGAAVVRVQYDVTIGGDGDRELLFGVRRMNQLAQQARRGYRIQARELNERDGGENSSHRRYLRGRA